MSSAIQVMKDAFMGTVDWTWKSIIMDSSVPWYQNYFYGLIAISVAVYLLELAFPWRKEQKAIRKDFWLDGFYMFFNFFIFSIAIAGVYALLELGFQSVGISMKSIALIDMSAWPMALQLLVFFIVIDFVQWATHVALHRFEFLWRFHQVHHSVEEMGFAAHLRYHWMENIFYKPLKTIGVMLLGGFEPEQAYIVHFVAISIGHLNHANIHITWGPLRYVFNNPVMHLWHHVYHLPEGRTHGINFGISLSLWDYLFGTASIPKDDAHIKLGYPGVEDMPKGFWGQLFYGFRRKANLDQ
ncbi:MAG: sterol desaturase family protein [Flavobacteriales bacterium]|nr:sterol desaturase family protein [Flavobacteriales bacterium]